MSDSHHDTPNFDKEHDVRHALARTLPEAEHAFQHNLEEQLLAKLTSENSQNIAEDNIMPLFNEKQKRGNTSRMPLTLAAAIIAIVLVGGLTFFVQGTSDNGLASDGTEVAQDTTCDYEGWSEPYTVNEGDTLFSIASRYTVDAESISIANCLSNLNSIEIGQTLTIPIPVAPVVIAIREIPVGTEISQDQLATILFPLASTPSGTFTEIDSIVGMIAQTNIYPDELILANKLSDSELQSNNLVPVVIASRDIALNEIITPDMITVAYWTPNFAARIQPPESSFMNLISSPQLALGQVANTIIHAYEPMLMENIRPPTDCDYGESDCIVLPEGYVAIALPTRDEVVTFMPIGQRVDVLASMLAMDINENGLYQSDEFIAGSFDSYVSPAYITQRIIQDATLINVDENEAGDGYIIVLFVLPQDATLLSYFAEAQVPMVIVPHVEGSDFSNNETAIPYIYPMTADGLAIISIPLSQVSGMTRNIGDSYDVQFSLPPSFDEPMIEEATGAGDVVTIWRVDSLMAIENSTLLYLGRGTEEYPNPLGEDGGLFLALTVNLSEAWLVDWYVQNGARFTLKLDEFAIYQFDDLASNQANTNVLVNIMGVDDIGNLEGEAIHIRNAGDSEVNLEGWTLEDEDGNVFEFGELLVFANAGHIVYTGSGSNTPLTSFWGLDAAILETGEAIYLYDANGVLRVQYQITSE